LLDFCLLFVYVPGVLQTPQYGAATSAGRDANVAAAVSHLAGFRTESPHQPGGSRSDPHRRDAGGQCTEGLDERAGNTADENPRSAAAHESNPDLDRRLRALSGRASRCRLIEGWLARDLLERRKWQPLGFVRLGDYTRERLGIGARCLEEEVRVADALRGLPLLTSSFLDGTLTWTAVRLLVDVASTQDEAQWIDNARGLSSRALAELVGKSPRVKPDADVEDPEDDDPRLRWSVRVSPSGRLLWRSASELAQRVAGSTLTPAQVLELVAAEAGGCVTGSADFEPPLDPDCLALLERLRNGIAEPAPAAEARERQRAAEACDRQRATGAPDLAGAASHDEQASAHEAPSWCEEGSIARDGVVPSLPTAPTAPTAPIIDAEEATRERSLSELVAESIRRGGPQPLSFLTEEDARDLETRDPSLAAFYCEMLLVASGDCEYPDAESPPCEPSASTIADPMWFEQLIANLAEAEGFAWLTAPAPACRPNPVDWLEAEFARLEAADPHTIDARLREVRRALQALDFEMACLLREAAGRRLYRNLGFANLELYVESCLGICARTAWSLLAVERATRRSCPLLGQAWRDGRVSWLAARILAPVVSAAHGEAWIERARIVTLRRLEAEVLWAQNRRDEQDSFQVPGPPPLDHNLGDPVAALTIPGLQMRAQAPPPDGDAGDQGYLPQVQIDFFAPGSVVGLAEYTLLRLRSGSEPRGRVFERMLALAMLEWMSAPAHRDPVFDRDGWRCAVPGCSSRRNLHDHHIVFRSHGGGNGRDNRITVCAAHHLHGLHRGRVRAHGEAPHGILWEIGCRFGGDGPLARFYGDRYV